MSADPTGGFRAVQERARARNVPLSVIFELTERCNYACRHCYLHHDPSGELTTDQVRNVLDELAEAGTLFLTLTGGEVFLRKDFFDIAAHARRRGFALRVFSNGFLIDEARAEALAALHPIGVEISLYGHNAATFEAVTGVPGSFERTCRAIRTLVARGVRVQTKTPVLRTNAPGLEALADLADELEVPLSLDTTVTPMDDGSHVPLSLRPSNEDIAAAEQLRMTRLSAAEADFSCAPEAGDLDEPWCNAGRSSAAISPKGDVFACLQIKEALGNLRQASFTEIWGGAPQAAEIRSLTRRSAPVCASCEDLAFCNRCQGVALLEDGSLTAPSAEACRIAAIRRAIFEANGAQPSPAHLEEALDRARQRLERVGHGAAPPASRSRTGSHPRLPVLSNAS